jgi:glycosyltransferase involved in cell wall biosynthesis
MCTFNGGQFLNEQLQSIAMQDRLPDELIVCDDRSTDRTVAIVEDFAASAPFPVHVSVNEARLGTSKNFERAIRLAEGEIIALADQDDVWDRRKLGLLESMFSRRPSLGLVFTDAELVDETLSPAGGTLWEAVGFGAARQKLMSAGRGLEVLLANNVVTGATMAFRARYRDPILPMPTEGSLYHDGWIALIVAALAEIGFIGEPLIKYRQHRAQQMGAPKIAPVQNVIKAKRTDRNSYLAQAARFQQAWERLDTNPGQRPNPKALSAMADKIVHLHARAMMPARRLRRLPLVVKEIVNSHYHQYSRGLFSAAKDLLV